MIRKNYFILIVTLIFCIIHFTLITSEYLTISYFILLIPGILLIFYTHSTKFNIFPILPVAILIYVGLLYMSRYRHISTIICWMSLTYIIHYVDEVRAIKCANSLEKYCVIIAVIICFYTFVFGLKNDMGDFEFNSYQDANYSSVVIFLLFSLAEKRGIKGSKLLLISTLLLFSNSRGLVLMTLLFYFIRLLKKCGIRFPSLNQKKVFIIFFTATVFTVIFSYIWVAVNPYNEVGAYRTTLNDGSNFGRFSANIYAWQEQLCLFNYNSILCGFGDDLKYAMGIPNNERVLYNGVRLVQTHNSILNILVSFGWIPGVAFIWILSGFIGKYFTNDNYEYIIPFFVDSMLISIFKPDFLIFWCMIIALPCVKKKSKKLMFHCQKGISINHQISLIDDGVQCNQYDK